MLCGEVTLTRREVPFNRMNFRAHAVNTSVSGRLKSAKSLHSHATHPMDSPIMTLAPVCTGYDRKSAMSS